MIAFSIVDTNYFEDPSGGPGEEPLYLEATAKSNLFGIPSSTPLDLHKCTDADFDKFFPL